MPVIREYQQQFGAKTADLGRRATPEDFGDASGLANLGAGIYRAGVDIQRIEEQREIADAQVKMAEADMTWDQKRRDLQKSATPGVSTAAQIQQDMTNYFTQFAGNYKSEAARNYVKLHGTRLTNQNVNQSAAFDVDLAVRDRFEKLDSVFDTYSKKAYADPAGYKRDMEALKLDAQNRVGLFDMPGDARTQIALDKEIKKRFEGMAWMAAQGDISNNPVVRASIAGSVTSQASGDLISSLLKREGGYVAQDAKRGESNYGINRAAHPNEDIKGMTQQRAAEIYKRDYWDAYGIGELDPSVQAIVFDGVVNHRSGFKEQLVQAAQAGASVADLAQMRMAEYKRLIDSDPKTYAEYEKSWTKRVTDTMNEVGSPVSDTPPKEFAGKPAWWDDLSPEQQVRAWKMAETRQKRETSVADHALKQAIKDQEAEFKLTNKLTTPMLPRSSFKTDFQYNDYAAFYNTAKEVEVIIDAPVSVQAAKLEAMKPVEGQEPGMYASQAKRYSYAAKLIRESNEKREEDPIGASITRGFSTQNPVKPITDFSPDKFIADMSIRAPQAEAVSKAYGTDYRTLSESEAKNLKTTIDRMSHKELSEWMRQVSNGVTDKTALRATFAQIGKNDRALFAVSNLMMNNTATPEKTRSDTENILFGREIMAGVPKGTGAKEEKGFAKAALPTPEDVGAHISRYAGQLNIPEESIDIYREAIMAHYIGAGRSKNANADLSLKDKDIKDANIALLNKSIQAIMGEKNGDFVGTKAGSSVVLRPYGMDGSTFQNRVQEQVDVALGGKYRWGEYSLIHDTNPNGGKGYFVYVGNERKAYVDPTQNLYSDENRGITKSEQQRRIEDYQNRGFVGNLMQSFTGGTLNRGGAK